MAIALVGTRTFYDGSSVGDPHEFSFTVPSGATLLIVKATWEDPDGLTDVRWGGSGGTQFTKGPERISASGSRGSAIWYLINPTATTQNIWLDSAGTIRFGVEAAAFSGTDTTTPIADSDTGLANNQTSVSTDAALTPSGSNDWMEACACSGNASVVASPDGSAVETNDVVISTNPTNFVSLHSKEENVSAANTPGWTSTGDTSIWTISAILIKPSAGLATRTMSGTPQAVTATVDSVADNRPQMDGTVAANAATTIGTAKHVALLSGTPQATRATSDGTMSAVLEAELSGTPQAAAAATTGELDLWAQMSGTPDALEATADGVADLIAQMDGEVVANAVVASGSMATTTESVMSGTVQADPAATVVAEMLAIASAAGVPQAAIASSEGVTVVWVQMSGTPQALFATVDGELILLGVRTMAGVPQALTATVAGTATAEQPEVDVGVQQGLRHAAFRAISGTTGDYGGDALAAFAVEASVPAGASFNGAFVAWLQARLSSTEGNLDNLMQEFAEAEGAHNWSSLGTFDPVP